ncbi:MAG: hypothetical protein Q9164_003194, partial [Protoblastenia rupestris]
MDNRSQSQSPAAARQLPPPPNAASVVPPPVKTVYQGRVYSLEIVQQPIRARMCGFGDKDRRPITPPPCVRLRVTDANTGQPLDINEIDTAYFVLQVDLWTGDGVREVNIVRHSATSPSISAATATSYPPTNDPALTFAPQPVIAHGFYPSYEGGQPWGQPSYHLPRQNELSRHMQAAQQAQREDAMRIQHEQQQLQNQGHHHPLPHTGPKMHPSTQSFYNTAAMTATANGYYQGQNAQGSLDPSNPPAALTIVDPRSQPGGMFTRNLIGNLACAAFKLTYPENDLGIWFILQDLSVRTEGTFR